MIIYPSMINEESISVIILTWGPRPTEEQFENELLTLSEFFAFL